MHTLIVDSKGSNNTTRQTKYSQEVEGCQGEVRSIQVEVGPLEDNLLKEEHHVESSQDDVDHWEYLDRALKSDGAKDTIFSQLETQELLLVASL